MARGWIPAVWNGRVTCGDKSLVGDQPGFERRDSRTQEFLRRELSNELTAGLEELFAHEPAHVKAEFVEFNVKTTSGLSGVLERNACHAR